jgi:hypothetical protein
MNSHQVEGRNEPGVEGRSLLMSEDIFAGEIAAHDRALVERRYVLRPCVCVRGEEKENKIFSFAGGFLS